MFFKTMFRKNTLAINQPKKNKTLKGFTLMEVLIVTFMFSVLALSVTMIFSSSMQGKRNINEARKSYEGAQFAMNYVAKTLRTSIIFYPEMSMNEVNQINAFDYSQKKCISFLFDNNALKSSEYEPADIEDFDPVEDGCSGFSGEYEPIQDNYVEGFFNVVRTNREVDPQVIGYVTISLQVWPDSSQTSSDRVAHMQTSVSLRNDK